MYVDGGTIPMSLSNDHYYGYVDRFLVENAVTWLECAAASVCWSTMLVYYLEDPFGHLMDEKMGDAQGRTHIRGNLFSFNMPWEDIERCCHQACSAAKKPHRENLKQLQAELGVPHSEDTLALLVNVHIRGGSKDLAMHLSGLTLRVHVIQELIAILRRSGYPGYEVDGVNAPDKVAERLKERYLDVYGHATFIPAAVSRTINVQEKTKLSIIQDKVATPAEPANSVQEWDKTLRPQHIVAERSVHSQANVHENYKSIFAKYGNVNIQPSTKMINHFHPWYLGMAHPFTLPLAVGGYDVPHQPRWRRPEDDDIPFPRVSLSSWFKNCKECDGQHLHDRVGPACKVQLFDITRGLPQRIEGQYRRHWGITPALWNLYFRERINLGVSLNVKSKMDVRIPNKSVDEDAAMAAAALLKNWSMGFTWIRVKEKDKQRF